MPKNGSIYCSKDCADHQSITPSSQVIFILTHTELYQFFQQFQAAQQPLSQYVRHSVNFDQFEENSLNKEVSFTRYVFL